MYVMWKKPWWPPRNRHTKTYTTYIHTYCYTVRYFDLCMYYVCMYVCCVGEAGIHASDEDHARAVRAVSAPTISRKEDTRGHSNLQDIQRSRLMVFAPSHYIRTYIHSYILTYIHSFLCALKYTKVHHKYVKIPTYLHTYIHSAYIHWHALHTYIYTYSHALRYVVVKLKTAMDILSTPHDIYEDDFSISGSKAELSEVRSP